MIKNFHLIHRKFKFAQLKFLFFVQESNADASLDQMNLRKALEWELSLDARDLRSHAWYHGTIPRSRAEEIVEHDGDFLVRDCTSQPGNYVLSTRCKGQSLHFVINKVGFYIIITAIFIKQFFLLVRVKITKILLCVPENFDLL